MSSLRAIVFTCLVLLCVLNAGALPPFEIRSAPSGPAASSHDQPSASLKRTSFGLYLLHIDIALSGLKCKTDAYTLCLEIYVIHSFIITPQSSHTVQWHKSIKHKTYKFISVITYLSNVFWFCYFLAEIYPSEFATRRIFLRPTTAGFICRNIPCNTSKTAYQLTALATPLCSGQQGR